MTAVVVIGMWQAVGQTGVVFQCQRGKVRGHAMVRCPEEMAVGKVDQVKEGTETVLTFTKAAEAGALQHCQNGCTRSAPCVGNRHQTRAT
jgi:hypothetical protein